MRCAASVMRLCGRRYDVAPGARGRRRGRSLVNHERSNIADAMVRQHRPAPLSLAGVDDRLMAKPAAGTRWPLPTESVFTTSSCPARRLAPPARLGFLIGDLEDLQPGCTRIPRHFVQRDPSPHGSGPRSLQLWRVFGVDGGRNPAMALDDQRRPDTTTAHRVSAGQEAILAGQAVVPSAVSWFRTSATHVSGHRRQRLGP
jgi:hypothetical protein